MKSPDRSRVSQYTVPEDRAGQRLDNLLMAVLKGVPKSWVYRVIRKGQVRVNGSRRKAADKVDPGDVIRIPPVRLQQRGDDVPVPERVIEQVRSSVIDEDSDYLVVNKPAGLAVHAGSGLAWGLIDALRQGDQAAPLELVHRLDRETSGCLLLARSREALVRAQDQFRDGSVLKRYLCLMLGDPGSAREVDEPLSRGVQRGGERHVVVDSEDGRRAVTRFRCLEQGNGWSYCEATIETGRTHQIRVHAQHIGHPLGGDTRYGDADFNRRLKALGLNRLFLHCAELALATDTGEERVWHAPLAPELAAVLDRLGDEAAGNG